MSYVHSCISHHHHRDGPRHNVTIREHFTCKSSNVVYCISCRRCPVLYIGETGRMLRERTGEHLRAITRNPPGFPVAEHLNKPGHGLDDMVVRCVKQCRGTNNARHRDEMRLIFHRGTLRPHGLNVDFIFKRLDASIFIHPLESRVQLSVYSTTCPIQNST